MAIRIHIEDANVRESRQKTGPLARKWLVEKDNDGTIIASCDTEREAYAVRECINDLMRQLQDPKVRKAHGIED